MKHPRISSTLRVLQAKQNDSRDNPFGSSLIFCDNFWSVLSSNSTLLREIAARDFGPKGALQMLRLFACLMKSEDGYTTVECGILGCLAVIFVEK